MIKLIQHEAYPLFRIISNKTTTQLFPISQTKENGKKTFQPKRIN